jgi:hypothetical protein
MLTVWSNGTPNSLVNWVKSPMELRTMRQSASLAPARAAWSCCDAWNKLTDQPWRIISLGLRDWAYGS